MLCFMSILEKVEMKSFSKLANDTFDFGPRFWYDVKALISRFKPKPRFKYEFHLLAQHALLASISCNMIMWISGSIVPS